MRIERILANNPGPFTGPGTNTWILGDDEERVIVIDPGPIDDVHRTAIQSKVANRTVVGVFVTHTHIDHAPMANPLAHEYRAPAVGYGPGPAFVPDETLEDGDVFPVGSIDLEVVYTPGHADDHLCFRTGNALFSGDHIMGGSSVMVEALGPYLESLRKLRGKGLVRIHPGHGEEIGDPDAVIDWYIAHRLQRHEEILNAVKLGAGTIGDIVDVVYADVDKGLHPLAARSVDAHLTLLRDEGRIALIGDEIVVPPKSP